MTEPPIRPTIGPMPTGDNQSDRGGILHRPKLLVSVRSLAEAEAAHRGGADIIDIKDPAAGPLGRASWNLCGEVHRRYAGTHLVTAAGGELADFLDGVDSIGELQELCGRMTLVKLGTSRLADRPNWASETASLLGKLPDPSRVVLVAYADAEQAKSPPAAAVIEANMAARGRVAMVDTFDKQGPGLAKIWSPAELSRFVAVAKQRRMVAALAGRVGIDDIATMAATAAHTIGVRGAACSSGNRDNGVEARLVAKLREAIAECRSMDSRVAESLPTEKFP